MPPALASRADHTGTRTVLARGAAAASCMSSWLERKASQKVEIPACRPIATDADADGQHAAGHRPIGHSN